MSKSFKRNGLVILIMMLAVISMAFVGCTPAKDYTYKVTVLGLDGKAYKGATVQICEAGGNGVCYDSKDTDETGVATFDDEDIQSPETTKVIHVQGIPNNLTYEEKEINHGEEVTIQLVEQQGVKFLGGTGTGSYKADGKTIDTADWYEATATRNDASIYKLKFTSKDQKIFIKFKGPKANYGISNHYGDVDFKVTHLCVSGSDIVIPDQSLVLDKTDANNKLIFGQPDANSYRYFELSISKDADVNKDFLISFLGVEGYSEELGSMGNSGTGSYGEDGKTIDSANFNPFETTVKLMDSGIMRGVYKVQFKTDAKTKFVKFKAAAGVYGVSMYYTGSSATAVDAAHLQVSGETITKTDTGLLEGDVKATATDNYYTNGQEGVTATHLFKFEQKTDSEYQYLDFTITSDLPSSGSKTVYIVFTLLGDLAA